MHLLRERDPSIRSPGKHIEYNAKLALLSGERDPSSRFTGFGMTGFNFLVGGRSGDSQQESKTLLQLAMRIAASSFAPLNENVILNEVKDLVLNPGLPL